MTTLLADLKRLQEDRRCPSGIPAGIARSKLMYLLNDHADEIIALVEVGKELLLLLDCGPVHPGRTLHHDLQEALRPFMEERP